MNLPSLPNVKGALESALGSNNGRSQFELRIGPFVGGQLTVVSFEGREALNEPFVYDVVFSSSLDEDELQLGIFGFPACLSINADPHEPRVIQGLAVGFEGIGASDAEISSNTRRFMTRIVPRLWLAKHQRRSRVFQNKTAVQIATSVLDANGIKPQVQVGPEGSYPAIPFEYQRNETDLDFLHRVLATAGIFYYFRHASGLLDQLLPGAGEAAADLGAAAGAAGAVLGGAAAGVAGFVSDAETTLGMVTTLVLTDKADSTEQLGDTSLDAAGALKDTLKKGLGAAGGALTSAATGAFGAAGGSAVGAVTGAVGLTTGSSDPLVFDGNGQAAYTDTERVYSFRLMKEVRARRMNLRSWDLREARAFTATKTSGPVSAGATLNLSASLDLTGKSTLGAGLAGDFDADALPIAPREASIFEYQRDLGLQTVTSPKGHGAAERALLQERSDWMTAQGETDCRRLAPGYRFTLQKHPIGRLNEEYLVTEMRSQAYSPEQLPDPESSDFRNVFRCVPSKVDPKPKKPMPLWGFPAEPAVVVGPTRGDVHCDSLGRIQVRFRWAAGSGSGEDDDGVCWVHWLERWGGDGYGTQTLPRVGSEVLVSFLAGGEPIAEGQIRSSLNVPAFSLPTEATKVGVKTRTVPNGGESEISIDDNPNSERVLVRASGDFDTEVARSTRTNFGGTYDLTVADDRTEATAGDAVFTYAKNVDVTVDGTLAENVTGDRLRTVAGSATENVEGSLSRNVNGSVDTVTHGPHSELFASDSVARHLGHHAVIIAGSDPTSAAFYVDGALRASAKGAIEALSLDGFTISCGKSQILITKDAITLSSPTILLVGKAVQVTASDTAAVAAKTATVTASDSVTVSGSNTATLTGKSATVVVDDNVTIQGAAISHKSGNGSHSQSSQTKKAQKTTLRLTDANGNPRPNERAILRKGGQGGEERVVVLDDNGAIEIEGDDAFDVFFPDAPDAKS